MEPHSTASPTVFTVWLLALASVNFILAVNCVIATEHNIGLILPGVMEFEAVDYT